MIWISSIMLICLPGFIFSAAVTAVLTLDPTGEVIADDFTLLNRKLDDSIRFENTKRKIYRDMKMGALLYIDDEKPGIISGIINSQLKIEPYHLEKLSEDGRMARRESAILESENRNLVNRFIPRDFNKKINEMESGRTDDNCKKIEVAFVTDSVFTERFNTHAELKTYLTNTLNEVENMFNSSGLRIEFALLGIMKFTKENETEAPFIIENLTSEYPEGIDSKSLHNSFQQYYCGLMQFSLLERADAVFLMTGRKFLSIKHGYYEPSIDIGHANSGGICHACHKYSVIQATRRQTFQAYKIIAHEFGHMLGSVHDGEDSLPYLPKRSGVKNCSSHIMRSFYDYNATTFSQCSVNDITNFLQLPVTNCIREKCQDK